MATVQAASDMVHMRAEHHFSWIESYVVRLFHPRSITIDIVGFIWFSYYLWANDWKAALGVAVLARALALVSVLHIKTHELAETVLGKLGLLHLNPYNLMIQLIGLVVFIYGLWQHSLELFLVGLSVIFLGHLFGWEKVDRRLGDLSVEKF